MTIQKIEQRLAAVERDITSLKSKQRLRSKKVAHPVDTLDKIHGTFAHDAAFQEAMRLGRKWRALQNPKPRKARG